MVLTTLAEMHAYSPQKMHMPSCMRAYATVQKLLWHGSYCELILSLARASCRLSFAVRSCHPSCCLDQTRCKTLFAREQVLFWCLHPPIPFCRLPFSTNLLWKLKNSCGSSLKKNYGDDLTDVPIISISSLFCALFPFLPLSLFLSLSLIW